MSAVIDLIHLQPKVPLLRRAADSEQPTILSEIYREDTNIAIWRRKLSNDLQTSITHFLEFNNTFKTTMAVSPGTTLACFNRVTGNLKVSTNFIKDVDNLVTMFCLLFDLKQAGLRLAALDSAMCPKFHFDRVLCRLVTTYYGVATEWLPHKAVDRTKLGVGSRGQSDDESGIFKDKKEIQRLRTGDVALLKGELWENNEYAGLVHRSPLVSPGEVRLLLTLDFLN